MSKWEMVKLGDVCEIARGGSPRPIDKFITNNSDGVNWIKIGDTDDGEKYITKTKQKIIIDGIKKSRKVYVGDFLLSNSMSFGKPFILAIDGCIHDGWLVIRDKNNLFSKDFLYYLLSSNSMYAQFKILAVGGVVNNLNSALVRNVKIPLPPLEEQKRIAKNLDLASKLVKLHKTELIELDKLIQSVFYDMFGDPVSNEKGWEVGKLSQNAKIITGNTPPRNKAENYGKFIEWIKTDNITKEIHLTDAKEHLSEKGLSKGRYVEENTILMACIAGSLKSIGRVAIANRRVAFNQQINAIIPIKYNLYFLYVLFKQTQNYIQSTINMSLKGILSKGKLETLEFILPPLPLQQKFADIVTQIEEQKTQVKTALVDAEMLYNSLMQEYFE